MVRVVGVGVVLGAGVAISAAVVACTSFAADAATDTADATAPDAVGSPESGAVTAPKRRLYLFGGEEIVQLQPKRDVPTALSAAVAQDGSLGPWEREVALDVDRSAAAFTVVDGVAMFFGGATGAAVATATAQKATVGAGGQASGSAWMTMRAFGLARSHASVVASNGVVYLSGGTTDKSVRTDRIERYDIGINVWSSPQSGLNEALAGHATLVHGGRLYVFGGEKLATAGVSREVSAAEIIAGGALAGWGTVGVLPVGVAYHGLALSEPYVFTIGGATGPTDATPTIATVQRGRFDDAGDVTWQNAGAVPVPAGQNGLADACVVSDGQTLYVMGGRKDAASPSLNGVYIGRVDAMGAITWKQGPVLPEGRAAAGCAISPSSAP